MWSTVQKLKTSTASISPINNRVPISDPNLFIHQNIFLLIQEIFSLRISIKGVRIDLGQMSPTSTQVVPIFIVWQAPRAGSMRRILCFDWLPEQARWSDTARPGLPVSFPQIKSRQSSSGCTRVSFAEIIFC